MVDSILNPRRDPRAPVPCSARVALRAGSFFAGPTIDCGPKGCQLETPLRLGRGARVFVELANERIPTPGELSGHVAWSAQALPWRAGVAFDEGSLRAAGRFFERLAEAYPDSCTRSPDSVPEDAPLAPASPPAADPLLLPLELDVLRAVGAGIRAGALRAQLGERWDACVNPLFALLGRGYLVVGAPDERAAAEWDLHLVHVLDAS